MCIKFLNSYTWMTSRDQWTILEYGKLHARRSLPNMHKVWVRPNNEKIRSRFGVSKLRSRGALWAGPCISVHLYVWVCEGWWNELERPPTDLLRWKRKWWSWRILMTLRVCGYCSIFWLCKETNHIHNSCWSEAKNERRKCRWFRGILCYPSTKIDPSPCENWYTHKTRQPIRICIQLVWLGNNLFLSCGPKLSGCSFHTSMDRSQKSNYFPHALGNARLLGCRRVLVFSLLYFTGFLCYFGGLPSLPSTLEWLFDGHFHVSLRAAPSFRQCFQWSPNMFSRLKR